MAADSGELAQGVEQIPLRLSQHGFAQLWATFKRDWPIWLIAGGTLANGLLSLILMLAVRYHERPQLFTMPLPFGLYHWSRSLTLVFGLALIYLSYHLFQRRRAAWWLALGAAALATLAHIGRGALWVTAAAPVAMIVLLLLYRRRFTVRSEPRSVAQGLGLMAASLLIALAYGTAGFWLMDQKDFGLNFTVADSLLRTLREFTLIGNSDLVAHTRHARWFLGSLHVMGLAALVFALYSLFRPVAYRLRTLPHQRALMKGILEQHGGTSLDYFKLWHDKSYFFSADQRCGVAYRTVGGVALSLGDPAGPADGLEDVTRSFLCFCQDNGWAAAFHQAQPDSVPLYRRLGLQVFKIGEEAIVVLERFATETMVHSKHLRHKRNKFEKEGYKLSRHLPPHETELLDEIEAVSKEWLQIPGRRERSFSMGTFDRAYVNGCPLAVLRGPDGRMLAFANEIPSYRRGEATIDLMRHCVEVPNGAMDYLFSALMLALREQGFLTFNLGMAPYAGVGDEPGAPLEERAAHQLAEHLTRFGSYKGMRDFKSKFEPDWEDRFLAYQGGPLGLVKTGIALVQATDMGRA